MCLWGCTLALLALTSGVSGVAGGSGGSLSRVGLVTPGNLRELRRHFPVLALLRGTGDNRGHRREEVAALEEVAQELEQTGIGFGLVDPERDPELAQELGLAGSGRLWLLRGSVATEYRGELTATALREFLTDVAPVRLVVAGKELQEFGDIEEEPKAIGFFEGQDSETFLSFSSASLLFHPSILFFATFDPQAAAQLGLELNQIDLYEPFLERPRSLRGGPGDTPGMETFLGHSRTTLRKLRAQNPSETWEDTLDRIHIVAFAEGDDPDGFEFLETLKEVAQDKRDDPNFSILWIDPDDFPLLVPSWEDIFDIDLSRPQLGVVNGTDHAGSVWMDMEDEEDLPGPEEVLEWLEEVLEGNIEDNDGDGEDEDEDDDKDDEDDEDGDDDDDDNEDDDDE